MACDKHERVNLQFKAEKGLTHTVPLIEMYKGIPFAFTSSLLSPNLRKAADTSDIEDAGKEIDAA